jgi:hypothetical protein
MREVLRRFRASYPHAELHVVNDGGRQELGQIAEEFQATTYEYRQRTSTHDLGLYFRTAPGAVAFVERVLAAANGTDFL